MAKVKVRARAGTPIHAQADVLITWVNTYGQWSNGVSGSHILQTPAGVLLYDQLFRGRSEMLQDGQIIHAALKPPVTVRPALYGSLLFVVDDLKQSLDALVKSALEKADELRLVKVALEMTRTTSGAQGITVARKTMASSVGTAIGQFSRSNPRHVREVTVYTNANMYADLILKAANVEE